MLRNQRPFLRLICGFVDDSFRQGVEQLDRTQAGQLETALCRYRMIWANTRSGTEGTGAGEAPSS